MSERFYPDTYPRIINEPLKTKFEIIKTENQGEGIISKINIPMLDIAFTFTGILLPFRELFTLEVSEYLHVYDPYFMGKVLHSCDPNLRCDMDKLTFYAIKSISPGDFLTMDYETTESELYRQFVCNCGAPNCRKHIKGYAIK